MDKATKKEPAHVRAVRKAEARSRARFAIVLDEWVRNRAALEQLDPSVAKGAADAGRELRGLLGVEVVLDGLGTDEVTS